MGPCAEKDTDLALVSTFQMVVRVSWLSGVPPHLPYCSRGMGANYASLPSWCVNNKALETLMRWCTRLLSAADPRLAGGILPQINGSLDRYHLSRTLMSEDSEARSALYPKKRSRSDRTVASTVTGDESLYEEEAVATAAAPVAGAIHRRMGLEYPWSRGRSAVTKG